MPMNPLHSLVWSTAFVIAFGMIVPNSRAQGFGSGRGRISITLLPEARVDETVIFLDQIATLSGGSTLMRQRLAKMDIGELPLNADRVVVSSEQVKFRLLLANVEESQFHITGAKRTMVAERENAISPRKIALAAERIVRSRHLGDPRRTNISAQRAIVTPTIELGPNDRAVLDAAIQGRVPSEGKVRVDVSVGVNGRVREVVPITVEITSDDANVNPMPDPRVRPAAYPERASSGKDFAIKTRDIVKIIAQVGAARLEASGEAQQDGRLGDVIRVRNLESSRIVSGRIESRGIVVVDY